MVSSIHKTEEWLKFEGATRNPHPSCSVLLYFPLQKFQGIAQKPYCDPEMHLKLSKDLGINQVTADNLVVRWRKYLWKWSQSHRILGPAIYQSLQFSSVAQSCPTLCEPMNRSTPGLPVHHQLPEFTQTHIHRVSDAIQPSHHHSLMK